MNVRGVSAAEHATFMSGETVRPSVHEVQTKFSHMLNEAIHYVNNMQHQSDLKTQALATGNIEHLHDVMITAQKASITLQATVEIRNKVIEAYQEIMRMQV